MKTIYNIIRQITDERTAARKEPRFAPSHEVYRRVCAEGNHVTPEQYRAEIRRLSAGDIIRVHPSMHHDLYEPLAR